MITSNICVGLDRAGLAVRSSAAATIEQYIVFVEACYKHVRCTNSKLRVLYTRNLGLSELPWSGALRLDLALTPKYIYDISQFCYAHSFSSVGTNDVSSSVVPLLAGPCKGYLFTCPQFVLSKHTVPSNLCI